MSQHNQARVIFGGHSCGGEWDGGRGGQRDCTMLEDSRRQRKFYVRYYIQTESRL
jgi:hypothetical protein